MKCNFLNCRYVELVMEVQKLLLHNDKLFFLINFLSTNYICKNLTQLTLFIFIEREFSIHNKMYNVMIHMKTYGGDKIWIFLIWLCTWKINLWTLCTTTHHTFPIWKWIFWWWVCTHCCHCYFRCCLKILFPCSMVLFLYVSNEWLVVFPDFLFCALQLWYSSFFQKTIMPW